MSEDEALLRALFDEHGHALWAFVVPLTGGDPTRAQDVVQETMLRAWRTPEILEQRRGSVRSWLFTVARRIVIDEWRRRDRRQDVPLADAPEDGYADQVDALLDAVVVSEALSRLTADHRAVLDLCYYRRYTTGEAAVRLGVPEGTVKSRAHYALRALRLALQEMGVQT
ncbi:sigma-70 family RNA polymerase sigma factor [Leekyejoonella antrihumi]|uniref:RNA polymerase sigma factor n=1 Tax=Leekyejoonella antrihumi TaxID=1660198 RepID=A0A563E102_9MICO|nr:sigma-70 family RNA polymerase sigma factor [Leekyejoonella antrihumi]TWP36196.1 sigma-70 family RNA polymerase sigma factor [Leekyejoonella antrihumi]